MVSEIFDPAAWRQVPGFDFDDITYHRSVEHGTVRIAFNRPEVRNAFRPRTVDQLYTALDHARMSTDVGCVLLTGNGPSPKDGGWAFCSGGDQRIRGKDGYKSVSYTHLRAHETVLDLVCRLLLEKKKITKTIIIFENHFDITTLLNKRG